MESKLYKVTFSVGAKLILFIVSLLLLFILFMNISTIFILNEDKKAYIYQAQSNECVLAGREFVNMAQHGIDFLTIALSVIDPRTPINPAQALTFNALVNNQNDLIAAGVAYVNIANGSLTPITEALKNKNITTLGIKNEDFQISHDVMSSVLPGLLQKSFAFVNLSQSGKVPLLGVILADLNLKSFSAGMPVAIGVISLKNFGSNLEGSQMTISDYQGNVLFDLDPMTVYGLKEISNDPLLKTGVASKVSIGVNEYNYENIKFLGSYTKPGLDLLVTTRIPWAKAARATYSLIEKFIVLGLLGMGAALLFAILFAKTLMAPINKLYTATTLIAQGNFDVSLTAQSKDEIGALTHSFNFMLKKINQLIAETTKNIHLENEMAIVAVVQQNLIPLPLYIDPNIHIYGHYQSASVCGGDWWGYFTVKDKMCLMIADATGHGLPSALITASAMSCFSVMEIFAKRDPDFSFSPGNMLSYANQVIRQASQGDIMMTFFIAVIDFSEKTLTFSNAGHNPPWLFRKTEDGYESSSLMLPGPRLGDLGDTVVFEEKTVPIAINDILFLYTDGILEGTNLAGAPYGKKKVHHIVQSMLDEGPEGIVKGLIQDFLKYNENKSLDDDITIAAAIILDPKLSIGQ